MLSEKTFGREIHALKQRRPLRTRLPVKEFSTGEEHTCREALLQEKEAAAW